MLSSKCAQFWLKTPTISRKRLSIVTDGHPPVVVSWTWAATVVDGLAGDKMSRCGFISGEKSFAHS